MAKLLSGSTLRNGGSGEFINLSSAQPQLPATDTTTTGYTLVTDVLLRTTYRSSLGNLEFNKGVVYNNIPNGNITLAGTGTGIVIVSAATQSDSTTTGALVVNGGVGIGGTLWTGADIHVNGLTIGQGYQGNNNIVVKGIAVPQFNEYKEGQLSIAIGYDALNGISTSYKSIAMGRNALSSGTLIANSIAIGDGTLKAIGTVQQVLVADIDTVFLSTPINIFTKAPHSLSTGTRILVQNIVDQPEINNQYFYITAPTSSSIELYYDLNLSQPADGITNAPGISGTGTIFILPIYDNNIAIGVDSATALVSGEMNTFVGHNVATKLIRGSYNVFMGHEIANNVISGDSNISIGGDRLQNGLSNQISIGSVLYYNGQGYLDVYADTTIIGSISVSSSTGALTVSGGVGVSGSIYSAEGNIDENFLVYSPSVTVSTTAPQSPHIGDFWIDPTINIEFQYIKDGTNRFWVQFAGL